MITEAKAVFAVRFLLMQCVSVMCVCVLVWKLVAQCADYEEMQGFVCHFKCRVALEGLDFGATRPRCWLLVRIYTRKVQIQFIQENNQILERCIICHYLIFYPFYLKRSI